MRTINLNDASIKIANSDNAIKKEKNRLFGSIRDGWGAGLLNLKDGANVNIDQSNATSEVIAMVYGGSILNAPATPVFKIVYQGNSIRVGNEILTSSLQAASDLIDIKINNADFSVSTVATSTDLIRVEPQQAKVQAAFTGADTSLTAA